MFSSSCPQHLKEGPAHGWWPILTKPHYSCFPSLKVEVLSVPTGPTSSVLATRRSTSHCPSTILPVASSRTTLYSLIQSNCPGLISIPKTQGHIPSSCPWCTCCSLCLKHSSPRLPHDSPLINLRAQFYCYSPREGFSVLFTPLPMYIWISGTYHYLRYYV